ncbi:MAG: hypothetical protein HRT54_13040 [Colwellia sp.]|nr:hypothetical protein [Colwellia sp.]
MDTNKNIQEVLDSLKGLQTWWQRDRLYWNEVFSDECIELDWEVIDEWDLNFIDHVASDFFPLQVWQCILSGKRKAQICRRIISFNNDDTCSFTPVIQWSITLTDNTRLQKFYPPSIMEKLLNEKTLKIQNDFMFKYRKFDSFELRFMIEKINNQSFWNQSNRQELVTLLSRWARLGAFKGSLGHLQKNFVPVERINSVKSYEY